MSNQIVETPQIFLDAVQSRFGRIPFDLAATAENAVTDDGSFFGPGSLICEDSLTIDWVAPGGGLLWLNPPFKRIEPWARKCAEERRRGARIAMLAPAAVCTGWFIEHVGPHAYVFELTPRVFRNEIRDCILALYEPAGYVGRETWKWKP